MHKNVHVGLIITALAGLGLLYEAFLFATHSSLMAGYYEKLCKNAVSEENWAEAIDDCTRVIETDNPTADAYILRSEAYRATGETDRAEADALAGSEVFRMNMAGANKRDIDLLEHAPPNDEPPGNERVMFLVEEAESLSRSDPDKAEQDIQEAIKIDPNYPIIYRAWGEIYFFQQDYAATEEKYKQWLAKDPTSSKPYSGLGVVKFLEKDYAASNDYLGKARALHPTNINLSTFRCDNFVRLKQWQDAVTECSEAITMNEGRKEAKSEERTTSSLSGHAKWYLGAEDYFVFTRRAVAYRALGQTDKANKDADAAARAFQQGNF